jgi:cytidylate kinase
MKKSIAISGKSGCGNTTISKAVAAKLNYENINYTFKQLSIKHNLTFEDMLEKSRTDDRYDKELDEEQKKQASIGRCVLGSRLAIWLLRDQAFTVYLNVEYEKRVKNILKREGGIFSEVSEATNIRDENDHTRFLNIYNIDIDDYFFVDHIVNATNMTIQEIVDNIVTTYNKYII